MIKNLMSYKDFKNYNLIQQKKYRNCITVMDGIRFHSKGEATRWKELKLLENAGKIKCLQRQKKFIVGQIRGEFGLKKISRNVIYICDFYYINLENSCEIVEDFKGYATKEYLRKRKAFIDIYPDIVFYEVYKDGTMKIFEKKERRKT